MNRKINIFFLLFILSGCINNLNSSSIKNSSSFKGYDDISSTIVDPGSYDKVNQFVVEGKVISIDGTKVKPFNTDMTLTSYSEQVYNSLSPIYDYHIKRLHILFDRYNKYYDENGNIINNLNVINDSYASNKEIIVDQELFNLLELSIELAKITKGYFNPTMGSLIDGWNKYFSPFGETNDSFTIQDENNITSRIISIVDYKDLDEVIELNKEKLSVKFNRYNKAGINTVIISLGAIAKGYAIEYLKEKYARHEVPLILSGSASSTYVKGINPNPNRDNWTILVNSPYKDVLLENYPLIINELTPEHAISTSGDYEQSFYYYDNDELIRRHHILNPYTGHSEDYYRSVTLFSESRPDVLDALSTALFNINDFELIKEIIDEVELTYNINIDYMLQKEISDKTLNLYLNEGYEKTITKKYTDTIKINEIVRVE